MNDLPKKGQVITIQSLASAGRRVGDTVDIASDNEGGNIVAVGRVVGIEPGQDGQVFLQVRVIA